MNLEVYLYFKGNCRHAMEFYKEVFGGELHIVTVAEAPEVDGMPMTDKNWVMHSTLRSDGIKLMASDSPKASDHAAKIEISIVGHDELELRRIFAKLSEGGKVRMPLEKQFWGDIFGALEDKFGIAWNMNIGMAPERL